jgi:DNA-binding NtrC family response regulator
MGHRMKNYKSSQGETMTEAQQPRRDGTNDSPNFSAGTLEALNAGLAPGNASQTSERVPHRDTEPNRFGDLYGASSGMKELFALLGKVAPSQAMVLIKGESGTGKELVASTLHKKSDVAHKPFVAVNCGAFPANLVEAELFGHERGGFTGAVRLRKGCFERADGGTLFLDEITEMPIDMQVKLLRVLETGRFCRVGGDQEVEFKVRVVCATNRCPDEAVKAGILRSDLLYRLSVIPVELPALRDRGGDVDLLAQLFLDWLNADGKTAKTFSADSMQFLHSYSWPGNVRELKNLVQRAYLLADKELDLGAARSMSGTLSSPASAVVAPMEMEDRVVVPLGTSLAESERSLIYATLNRCGGNKTRAAEVLGVSLKTLYNRLHEYGTTFVRHQVPERQINA